MMMNIVNDEPLNMDKTILHHKEGVDLIRQILNYRNRGISGKCYEQGTDSGDIGGAV